jgi:exopolyphosphatase/guanosine-5'-triphosphate,3'-diphosphate pyrophosphatase
MGCVAISNRFFPDAKVTATRFSLARMFARRELQPVAERFRDAGWDEAVGTSGTIRATARMLTGTDNPGGIITRAGLDDLAEKIIERQDIVAQRPDGLGEQRAPVYPGGLAILMEVFDALKIDSMTAADGALREGLLYDLLGRLTDEDVRERSTRAMQDRFHCDRPQAERVSQTALNFLGQVARKWQLEGEQDCQLLKWAADLHEVGLDLAHAHHHRHGAYLLRHTDLAGFSTGEQKMLSLVVGSHRRKFREGYAADTSELQHRKVIRLSVLLRLAVLLNRSRVATPLPLIRLFPSENGLRIQFAPGWLDEHPLARADLDQEREYLAAINFRLDPCQGILGIQHPGSSRSAHP